MTANNIKPIPPDQAQDIQRAFEELDGRLKVSGKHPTLTTRGSLMIDHADGTRSHFSYKRPMTLDEVERTHTGLGASARKRTLMQKLIFWR